MGFIEKKMGLINRIIFSALRAVNPNFACEVEISHRNLSCVPAKPDKKTRAAISTRSF
jgi:hypothetical protein